MMSTLSVHFLPKLSYRYGSLSFPTLSQSSRDLMFQGFLYLPTVTPCFAKSQQIQILFQLKVSRNERILAIHTDSPAFEVQFHKSWRYHRKGRVFIQNKPNRFEVFSNWLDCSIHFQDFLHKQLLTLYG